LSNLPNLLTLIRIFLVPLLVAVLVQQNFSVRWNGSLLVANDFFAPLLDPVADKLLISAALISLVQIRLLPGWMVILIISREFAVSGLRSIAAAEGYTIKAGELGKSKMMLQVLGVVLIMLSIRWPNLHGLAITTMWAVVVFGLVSAVDYFRKFWRKVDLSIKLRRRNELLALERQKRRLRKAAGSKDFRAAKHEEASSIRRSG
jgi:CDP-diacylglycerol--glycerol-3-phosphate 3-phosphatidyltransferase